jgi:hypothetical protein
MKKAMVRGIKTGFKAWIINQFEHK